MGKQIKIGFDKVPAPVTKQYTQLVDIEGTKLFDAAGNPLVTEEEAASGIFTSGENALSVHINNKDLQGGNVKVAEEFGETSQVSSSLLGVPRAEEQLSLFSDVATYGLDEEQWNTYPYSEARVPYAWYHKKHPIFGRRCQPKFYEGSTEQALILTQFPSQYNYPRGPVQNRSNDPTEAFKKYMNFIALGKYLYSVFLGANETFANKYFISDDIAVIVDRADNPVSIEWDPSGADGVFKFTGSWHDVRYTNENEQLCYDQVEAWTYFWGLMRDGLDTYPTLSTGDYKEASDYDKIVRFAKQQCTPGVGTGGDRFAILESKRAFRYQPGRASGFTFGTRMASDPNSQASVLEWGCSNSTDEYMFQLKGSVFNIIRRSVIEMPKELLERQGLNESDQSDEPVYIKSIDNSIPLYETVIPRSKWNGDQLLGQGDSGYILSFEDVTMYKIEFSWYGAIGAKFYAYVPVGNGDARWVLLHTFVIENGLGEPVLANPDFKFKYLTSVSESATMKAPQFIYKYGSSYYVDGGDEGTVRLSTTVVDPKPFTTDTPILGMLPKNDILNSAGIPIENNKKSYPSTISVRSTQPCRIDIEEVKGSFDGVHFSFSPSIVQSGDHPDTRKLELEYTAPNTLGIKSVPIALQTIDNLGLTNGSATITRSSGDFSAYIDSNNYLSRGDTLTIQSYDYLVASVSSSEITLQSNFTGATTTTGTGTILKILNPADDKAKVIADGVYNVYTDYSSSIDKRSTRTLRRRASDDYDLVSNQTVGKSVKVDGISFIDPADPVQTSFPAKLSGYYTVVASQTPIYSNKFKIHWLNPTRTDSTYGRHFADFLITVTNHFPVAPGVVNSEQEKVNFLYDVEQSLYKEFDINEFPFAEYSNFGIEYDNIKRAELREDDDAYGRILDVDPRLNDAETGNLVRWDGWPNTANRSQAGRVQAVNCEIGVTEYELLEIVDSDGSDAGYGAGQFWKVVFANNVTGPDDDTIADNSTSEVGANFLGTGKFFESDVFRPSGSNAYFYATKGNGTTEQELNSDLSGLKLQLKTLTISDDFQVEAYDSETGQKKFRHKDFERIKIVQFNIQPLYPVFALKNNAQINSISIEEIGADGTIKTHNPAFVTESTQSNPNISIQNFGGSSSTLTPSAFNANDRLAALRYDSSTLNPLRPGDNITSFFVGQNVPEQIDLENIFDVDRRGVSRGLLNDKAIYFKATSLSGSPGEVEMTLITKEQ